MTVATSNSKSGPYAGAGTTGPFTVDFRFLDNSHLLVVKTSTADVETELVLDSGYTVTGAGGSSGTVTLAVALASGEKLTITRNVPATQEADYVQNDAFPAQSHELALDKLTMLSQQNDEKLGRTMKLPVSLEGVSPIMPVPVGGRGLKWNDDGTAVENSAQDLDEVGANAAASAAAAAASAALALTTLAITSATPPASPIPNQEWISSITGRHYTWLVDADSGQWVETFAAQVVDNPTLVDELRGEVAGQFASLQSDSGSAQIGVGNGRTLAEKNYEVATTSEARLVQKKMIEPVLGFNNGTVNTEIFPGAGRAPQGLAYIEVDGVEKIYVLQRVAGTGYQTDERQRIVEFNFTDTGAATTHNVFSNPINCGHAGLSALIEDGEQYFYSAITTIEGHEGIDAGKGFSRIKWRGALTDQTDVENYQLWGFAGSGHRFASFRSGNVGVSVDGRFVIIAGKDVKNGAIDDYAHYVFIYDRAEVMAAADSLTVNPIQVFLADPVNSTDGEVIQGVASDSRFIYIFRGKTQAFSSDKLVQIYDMEGKLVREIPIDGPRAMYGEALMLDHPTLGIPVSMESEDITLRGNQILVQITDVWSIGADIVTWQGYNWACTDTNTGKSPENSEWVRTNKPATMGAWNPATTYQDGNLPTRRGKIVYAIKVEEGDEGEEPLNSGIIDIRPGAASYGPANPVDVAYQYGNDYAVCAYSTAARKYFNGLSYAEGYQLRIYDQREGSDNSKACRLLANYAGSRAYLQLLARQDGSTGPYITLYGAEDSVRPNEIRMGVPGLSDPVLVLGPTGTVRAGDTNLQDFGSTSYFWKRGFFQSLNLGGVIFASGTGSPEGVLTGAVGSKYLRSDGVGATTEYRKATGTGNTGWVACGRVVEVTFSTAVPYTIAASTAEETAYSVTIPGGSLGPNGFMEIQYFFTKTASANAKTPALKLNGTTIQSFAQTTTTNTVRGDAVVMNRGATNSQITSPGSIGGNGSNNVGVETAIDTSANFTLTLTGKKDSAGELMRFEYMTVKVYYRG